MDHEITESEHNLTAMKNAANWQPPRCELSGNVIEDIHTLTRETENV